MSTEYDPATIHELDVSLWVGKRGLDPVAEELTAQLEHHDLVKVKFLRSARGEDSTEELAVSLAEMAGTSIVETRGHTAVFGD